MPLLSTPWPRAAVAVIAGTEAFMLSAFALPDEALYWGPGVGLAAGLFLLLRPALPMARRWSFLRLRDVLVPLVFFALTTLQQSQLLPQNSLRLLFGLIIFGGIGAAVRIAVGPRGKNAGPKNQTGA